MLQNQTQTIIMVNSITYAYMARDVLVRMNIPAYIERVPANLRNNGCGYGVRVSGVNVDEISAILQKAGVTVRDIVRI